MNSVLLAIQGVISFPRAVFDGVWLFFDIFLTPLQSVDEKRVREVQKDERDIRGKIVIVTGSNSGIGKQTAAELAERGARVIMACRRPIRAEVARRNILVDHPQAQLEFMKLDLSDQESIRSFVLEFKSRYDHLDILVNNAGMLSQLRRTTKDGFESHIGTNYLGTYLLTLLLLDSLLKAEHARIVFLSSSTIPMESLDLDNIMMKNQQPGTFTPYSNSKLCLAMFSKQLSNLLLGTNVTTYAVCPGFVRTNLRRQEEVPGHVMALEGFLDFKFYRILSTVQQGCATVLHCILSKSLSKESGRFYRDLIEWDAADQVIERHCKLKLWELSEKLVGLEGFANNLQNYLRNLKCNNNNTINSFM